MSKVKLSIDLDALEAAFEVCWLIRDHSKNVLALGEKHQSDIDNLTNANKFILAYNREVKAFNKRERKSQRVQKSINKLAKMSEEMVKSTGRLNDSVQ